MGVYVNPNSMEKEQWLLRRGVQVTRVDCTGDAYDRMRLDNRLPVVLIDNRIFTAAGVCFSKEEAEVLCKDDGRRKIFFSVGVEDLLNANSGCAVDLMKLGFA